MWVYNSQERIRAWIVRGGTSKAVFFLKGDLPSDPALNDKIILEVFGSPDIRQINGLGAAHKQTSKAAIIGPPTKEGTDVDYTFGQVMLAKPTIDWGGNCGNISSAVGPFAIYSGLVEAKEPFTIVRIHQTNTDTVVVAKVPVGDGQVVVEGDYAIGGVPGTGAKIELDFSDSAGAILKRGLLPTGNVKDEVYVPELGKRYMVSVVDAANVVAHVLAEEVGITGKETLESIEGNKKLNDELELLRGYIAQMAGIIKDRSKVDMRDIMNPFIHAVRVPITYPVTDKPEPVYDKEYDLYLRSFSRTFSKTIPGTGTVATSIAAKMPGTVVNELLSEDAKSKERLIIGHAGGTIESDCSLEKVNNQFVVKKATIYRTARILMEGYAFVRKSVLSEAKH